jgi:hypothetical protein
MTLKDRIKELAGIEPKIDKLETVINGLPKEIKVLVEDELTNLVRDVSENVRER